MRAWDNDCISFLLGQVYIAAVEIDFRNTIGYAVYYNQLGIKKGLCK